MSRVTAALAGLLVVVLSGCAGTEAEPSAQDPGSKVAAAKGTKISGTGYTYRVPKGWGLPPQEIPGFDPDTMAFNLRDKDRFADNVNVLLTASGDITTERVETDGVRELEAVGATNVSVRDRVTVAGSEAAHLSASMSMGTNNYRTEQFYFSDDEQTYVVTFSFSPSVPAKQRASVTGSTLASWTWTD